MDTEELMEVELTDSEADDDEEEENSSGHNVSILVGFGLGAVAGVIGTLLYKRLAQPLKNRFRSKRSRESRPIIIDAEDDDESDSEDNLKSEK